MVHASKRGFTLVELLVVVAIIGILTIMLLPAVQAARESARQTACKNNLRQIGLALHQYHDVKKQLPPGWSAEAAEPAGDPGWGWAAHLLPQIEEATTLKDQIDFERPIRALKHETIRGTSIPLYLCPSEPNGEMFTLPEDDGHDHEHHAEGEHEAHEHEEEHGHDPDHEGHYDEGHPLVDIARANYLGVFGAEEIEERPSRGDGLFYHNSNVRFRQITDGLSKTLAIGERSSRLGGSTWLGNVHEARESMARVVGSADHVPNSHAGHFEDFSSRHPAGVHFVLADGSVRIIDDQINERVYRAMATRAGREIATWEE